MLLHTLILVVAIVICLHVYFRYSYSGRLIHKLNGPKGIFLFGNIFDIFISPEEIFRTQIRWRKVHGNIFRLYGLHYRAVYLYKPEYIEAVLSSTRHTHKGMPYTFLYPWLGEGLLTSAGEKWQHRRKLLTPAFHFLILKKFFITFCERAEELMKTFDKEADKDRTELFPLLSKSTLSIMCETSMGTTPQEDIETLTNKYFQPVHTLSTIIIYRVTRLWLFTEFMFQFSNVSKIQSLALKSLNNFTTQIIQYRRKSRNQMPVSVAFGDESDDVYGKKAKLAMLDLLLDEERKGRIDEKGIREEVDTFMFEGHDTTATALCFLIMSLANEQKIQALVREEMLSIFGDSQRIPTIEDLSKMKYLECCIKESLRLYPSVHFISRMLTEDLKIDGYIIPKGTICNFNVFDIHRNPEIFPDPETFIPERFLPEKCANRHPYAYIPFSAGPRNCIGQKFAMMELKTVISSLLRKFHLEAITKPEELVFKPDLVLRTSKPVYVKFCKLMKND
ncbi:cytochrome P450 4C1-like [Trichoplusia ni]|uniref:Cytochrome P450 4C1-like n=1 Tax=Trichoplusia ni TaxID=7111 RepID=A0A7E5VYU8_TRINI|nr:cytochrome P450 4C1-like [Trichoplusia ni]